MLIVVFQSMVSGGRKQRAPRPVGLSGSGVVLCALLLLAACDGLAPWERGLGAGGNASSGGGASSGGSGPGGDAVAGSGADSGRPSDAGLADAALGCCAQGASDAGDAARAGLSHDAAASCQSRRNVILLIADGYGKAQIEATRMYLNGNREPLSFETLPYQASVTTLDARGGITDSGASATALATGHKVDSYVLSVALPGDARTLRTALEIHAERGKWTGLVTTHTSITDATPAAFAAHVSYRFDDAEIAGQYFAASRPNLLIGLTASGITAPEATRAGYTVVQSASELSEVVAGSEPHVSGQFDETSVPPLSQLATDALRLLEPSPEGFFLLLEQEQTDSSGHARDLQGVLTAAAEFDAMVQVVLQWVADRDDTLVVVGADHETGGLIVDEPTPKVGVIPSHSYTTSSHSGAEVSFFALGPGAEAITGTLDNTQLFAPIAGYHQLSCTRGTPCEAGMRNTVLRESSPNQAPPVVTALTAAVGPEGDRQSLLAFHDLQRYLPGSCGLQAAQLIVHAQDGTSGTVSLHGMLQGWSADSTWNDFGGNGVQANDLEARAQSEMTLAGAPAGTHTFDVTETVQQWLLDPASNQGWVIVAGSDDAIEYGALDGAKPPELRLYFE